MADEVGFTPSYKVADCLIVGVDSRFCISSHKAPSLSPADPPTPEMSNKVPKATHKLAVVVILFFLIIAAHILPSLPSIATPPFVGTVLGPYVVEVVILRSRDIDIAGIPPRSEEHTSE